MSLPQKNEREKKIHGELDDDAGPGMMTRQREKERKKEMRQ
jgi:hypothetical protein